jgi:hypothetical protein
VSTPAKRWLACVAATSAALGLVFPVIEGCGGSTHDEGEGGADSGATDGNDARSEPPVQGCQIPTEGGPAVPSAASSLVNTAQDELCSVQLIGITDDDDFAVYFGNTPSGPGVFAAPLSGGSPVTILAPGGSPLVPGNPAGTIRATIVQSTVFVWTGVTTDAKAGVSVGTISGWNPAYGSYSPSAASSTVGLVAASVDSRQVAGTANVSPDGTSADLVVADGTGLHVLLSGSTILALGFVNGGYLVAAHEEQTDSGLTLTLSSWDTTAWIENDLLFDLLPPSPSSPFAWSTAATASDAGATLVAATSAGYLYAIPAAGGDGDPPMIDTGVSSFYVKPDGTAVLYGTTDGGYKMASLPPATPTAILPGGSKFGGFIDAPPVALSPDGNWSVYYETLGARPGESDLHLIQNTASAIPTTLVPTPTATIIDDAFTANSAYALYYTDLTPEGQTGFVGHLVAQAVAGPSTPVDVSANAVRASHSFGNAAEIIYGDSFRPNKATGVFVVDLSTVDVSAPHLAPQSLVEGVDETYFLTSDRRFVVFALNTGNTTTDGIYAYQLAP